ncbi:MAG: hypothetical protein RMI79_05875 [Nitrososphaerota archaeon]|nr:hypothetical protein [Nitrososphaerota archaeon]
MEFTPLRGRIIDVIADYPEGTSFNKLADKLRGDLSRIVLSREIKNMYTQGLLRISRDPKHKQKKIISVESNIIDVINRIKEERHNGKIGVRAAFRITLKYIIEYRKLTRNISNPFLKEYVRYRVLKHLEKVLEGVSV